MSHIVLFEQSERECQATLAVLSENFPADDIRVAHTFDEAIEYLKRGSTDLLIASVPRFSYPYISFLSRAQTYLPDTPVLVTSTAPNAEVSSNVWRLGVTDYLLKPFRASWLVAAVRALLVSDNQEITGRLDWRKSYYVKRIGDFMHSFKYKKCIEATREYVDSLFDSLDNKKEIGSSMVDFARDVVGLLGSYSTTCQNDALRYLERLSFRFEQVQNKYDAYVLFEKLIERLFDLIEKEDTSGDCGIQAVLTYIDRHVHDELSLVDAAQFANMSTSYFSKYFKRETGHSFVSYVTDGKLELACLMLAESDMSVIQIANNLSYNGANYFSKTFKKKLGMTPSEYREQKQKGVLIRGVTT